MSIVIVQETVDVTGRPCWIAEDPDLPGCYSLGDTEDEAVAGFAKARGVWLAGMGDPVSKPRTQSDAEAQQGEAFTFTEPSDVCLSVVDEELEWVAA